MKRAIQWAASVAGAVAVLYVLTPQQKLDRAHESWLRLKNDRGIACLDYERQRLKDPDGARLLGSFAKDGVTTIQYKATNSYGAYQTADAACSIDEDGQVNVSRTEFHRRMERSIAESQAESSKLQRQIICLERTTDLQRRGISLAEAKQMTRKTDACTEVDF